MTYIKRERIFFQNHRYYPVIIDYDSVLFGDNGTRLIYYKIKAAFTRIIYDREVRIFVRSHVKYFVQVHGSILDRLYSPIPVSNTRFFDLAIFFYTTQRL